MNAKPKQTADQADGRKVNQSQPPKTVLDPATPVSAAETATLTPQEQHQAVPNENFPATGASPPAPTSPEGEKQAPTPTVPPQVAESVTPPAVDPGVLPYRVLEGTAALTQVTPRVPGQPGQIELVTSVLKPLKAEVQVSPDKPICPVETVLGPDDEPMVRFLNLKGIPPAWKMFEKGKPNPKVMMLLRREMHRHQMDLDPTVIEQAYHLFAAETVANHVFDPLDNELVLAVLIVVSEHDTGDWWVLQTGLLHRMCKFVAQQEGFETTGWSSSNWFSRKLKTLGREFSAVGVEIVQLDREVRGQLLKIRYRGPQPRPADATDAILPALPKKLTTTLREGEHDVVLVTGREDVVRARVDLLTKTVMCSVPFRQAPCGQCGACQMYHYADPAVGHPDNVVVPLPMDTLHIKANGANPDTLSRELSKKVAVPRFLAVVEGVDAAAAGFQVALAAVIEKDTRALWILTAEKEEKVIQEVATKVGHHVVC